MQNNSNKATFWGTFLGLIFGVVIGVLLTIWGVHLQQDYEAAKNDRELGIKICEIINARIFLSQNVVLSSSSTVFQERWNMYMEKGVMPWNIHKNMIVKFIEKKHDSLVEPMQRIDSIYIREIHPNLINIKNLQKGQEKDRKQYEKNAAEAIKKISKDIEKINKELYDF